MRVYIDSAGNDHTAAHVDDSRLIRLSRTVKPFAQFENASVFDQDVGVADAVCADYKPARDDWHRQRP